MSATISNLRQLATFMRANLFTDQFRPVKLRQFVKFKDQVAEINPSALADEDLLFGYKPFSLQVSKERAFRRSTSFFSILIWHTV